MTTLRIFEVGGSIRDEVCNITRKGTADRDFCVECEGGWDEMLAWCHEHMGKIFLVTPEFLTVRGILSGQAIDLVLCRKDGASSDGRHPDEVEPGTLEDDLKRRDFTVNALAREVDPDTLEPVGSIVDLFGGIEDCETHTLRCVGSLEDRFQEDGLRALRALRFWITKGMHPDEEMALAFMDDSWAKFLEETVSKERIREELQKCFEHDTVRTIATFGTLHPAWLDACFGSGIWLKPTVGRRRQ